MWRSACRGEGSFAREQSCSRLIRNLVHTRASAQAAQQGRQRIDDALAWPELALEETVYGKVEGVRVRQHVNPLKRDLQVPLPPQDWAPIYSDVSRPLIVDVGCGSGRFLMALSHSFKRHNLLGLDIRKPLTERANSWAKLLGLSEQVHYMMANATVSLESMLASYPGPLSLVTVQFPDPHFKARHKKRRIVQRQLVHAIGRLMPAGGRVFLQSDVEDVAALMHEEFCLSGRSLFSVEANQCRITESCLFAECIEPSQATPTSGMDITKTGRNLSEDRHDSQGAPTETEDDCEQRCPEGPSTECEPKGLHESGTASTAALPQQHCVAGSETADEAHPSHVSNSAGSSSGMVGEEDQGDLPAPPIQWLSENPLGVPTEREMHTLQNGGNVYRTLFVRR